MSRLMVITRPVLVPGFQLAGVEVYGPEDVETAQELIEGWLKSGETGLLAIDDGILERLNPVLVRQLNASEDLLYLSIPGGQPIGPEASRHYRITEMIRRAVGFHITFKGEEAEVEK